MAPMNSKALFSSVLRAIRAQREKSGSTSTAIITHLKSQAKISLPKSNLRYYVARSLKEGVDKGILVNRNSRFQIKVSDCPKNVRMNSKKATASSLRVALAKKLDRSSVKSKGKARRETPKKVGRKNSLEEKLTSPLRVRGKNEPPMRAMNRLADACLPSTSRQPRDRRAPKEKKTRRNNDALDTYMNHVVSEHVDADQNNIASPSTEGSCSAGRLSLDYEDSDEAYDEEEVKEEGKGGEVGDVDAEGESEGESEGEEKGEETYKDENSSEKEKTEQVDEDHEVEDFDGQDGDGNGEELAKVN